MTHSGLIPIGYTHRLPCGGCSVRFRPDQSPGRPWVAHYSPPNDFVRGDIPFHAETCEAAYDKLLQQYPCGCPGHPRQRASA